MNMRNVSVFGLGYVGLTFAVCLASKGFNVIGVDVDKSKINLISNGKTPFHEPGLNELLDEVLRNGNFRCTDDYWTAITESSISFICVGTPSKPDGSIDLKYVKNVSTDVGTVLKYKDMYHLIVVRSTVTPGTTRNLVRKVIEHLSGKKCGFHFGLCMNPEFLREGSAVHDIFHSDRVIIGEFDSKSGDLLESFYSNFYGSHTPPILRTSLENAELIKYANNAFLAMKISFINELANICEYIGNTDVKVIAKGIGLDHRVNPRFLNAGLGWGGSCFPKDVQALISFAKNLNYDPILLNAVKKVNDLQPYRAVDMAKKLLGKLKNKKIAILGLAFKPGTDDMRNAVSIKIVNRLVEEGARVVVYDPVAMDNARKIFGNNVVYADSSIQCIKGCDCCIIVTEWDEFRYLKPEVFVKYMRFPAVIDGRRIFDPSKFLGRVKYVAIGLGL